MWRRKIGLEAPVGPKSEEATTETAAQILTRLERNLKNQIKLLEVVGTKEHRFAVSKLRVVLIDVQQELRRLEEPRDLLVGKAE